MNKNLGFIKLSDDAFPPIRSSPGAVGFDLRSPSNNVVPKHNKQLIKTNLAIKLPDNCYGRIAPRSGLALNNFIDVGAGVIDHDYTGNICVLLFNHSDTDFIINKGDKIAQIICEMAVYPELYELQSLETTERGTQGFGSTGK